MSDEQMVMYKSYRIGTDRQLDAGQLESLAGFFEAETGASSGVLGGRGGVTFCTLEGTGPVVIKYYRRGGFIRHFIRQRYLRLGKTRSCREYEMLKKAKALGVPVAEPVLHAHSGSFFYKCWLVTEEIKGQKSLAQISREDESRAVSLMEQLAPGLNTLIENRIWHVDFHPGNVLVDPGDGLHIIDFDKARTWNGSCEELYEKYLSRWRRAVRKYNLPELLNDLPGFNPSHNTGV